MQALWILAAGLCFAVMAVYVKLGARYFSTAELVLYRSILGVIVMFVAMRHRGVEYRTERFALHVRRGILGFVALMMFFYTMAGLPLATAVTLNYTSPLYMALLLMFFARERPTLVLTWSVILGFAGAVLLLRPTLSSDQWWPGLIGLASGGVSALTYFNVRGLVKAGEPELRVVFYYALFSALGSLALTLPHGFNPLNRESVGPMIGVAIFGTLGQVFLTWAYGKGKTMVTATLSYSGIVFSSVLGIWIWGDVLAWTSWLAIAIIIASGIVTVWKSQDSAVLARAKLDND
jgi:drug/metabolite transporter (DMT)-like permease